MNILLVNKFLYPKGGAETYLFNLGELLEAAGHRVQYFGMEHPQRRVGNARGAYVTRVDFRKCTLPEKLRYSVKSIYSREARQKLRAVLEDFRPDVVHLNNFNYQLTPSIILEIRKWEKEQGRRVRIVYTAHDYQLLCPNHALYNRSEVCKKCLGGNFENCTRYRCIHGSLLQSLVGTAEAYLWNWAKVYRQIDAVICPSRAMAEILDTNPIFAGKTAVLPNFAGIPALPPVPKGDYILYFGRYSEEKGLTTLVEACRRLPEIPFRFAGSGSQEELLEGVDNIENLGFLSGEALYRVIAGACLTVYPSEWPENCPYSILESQALGTPVLAADIGGIPELIQAGETGELFESGNVSDLTEKLRTLYADPELLERYGKQCRNTRREDGVRYLQALTALYGGEA